MTDGPGSSDTRAQRAAKSTFAIILVLLGVWTLRSYLAALVWAAILAIAVWPLYRRACRRWPPGRLNLVLPALATLVIALVFLVPLGLAAVQAGHEAHTVLAWIDTARSEGIPPPAILGRLPIGGQSAIDWWQANLATPEAATALLARINHRGLAGAGGTVAAHVLHRAVLFGFTLLTLFFLFRDGDRVAARLDLAARRVLGDSGERVGQQIIASIHGTVDGLVLVGLGEGLVLGFAYALAGVPQPTLFGAFTAVAAIVPFGAPVLFGLAALLLVTRGALAAAIGIVVTGMAVTFIADHFIRPVLIGGATRLPFLWVLLGILGGVETWGLLGLFLGPAIMAVLILLWREWTDDTPA